MGDGQEVPEEFKKKKGSCYIKNLEEQQQTIVSVVCHGCGAMIEDVILGEDNWLFCPCGTGIVKVTS